MTCSDFADIEDADAEAKTEADVDEETPGWDERLESIGGFGTAFVETSVSGFPFSCTKSVR